MKVFALLLLVGCYAGFSSAQQVFGFGGCPEVRVVPDFDIERYFGLWFLITANFRTDLSCVSAEYLPGDKDLIRVINSGRSQDGDVTLVEGTAFAPDPNMGAKLKVQLFPGQTPGNYWVLDTDYDSYSLVHGCTEYFFGWFNLQSSWVLARDRMPSEDAIRAATMKFVEQGISVRRFDRNDQRDCGIEPPRPYEMPVTDGPRPSE